MNQPYQYDVTCDFEGQTFSGTYTKSGRLITVQCAYGSESATAGPHPDVTARLVLRGLVAKAKRQGFIRADTGQG